MKGANNMAERALQQSKSWDDYVDGKLKIDRGEFYRTGIPQYVYSENGVLWFKLILKTGRIVEKAYADLSRQYMAEGVQWRDIIDKRTIETYEVLAWKEI